MKTIPHLIPTLCVASLLIGLRGRCAEVTLNFDKLPSAQGWTTAFHDYRLEGQPGVRYDLYVDSILLTSGTPYPLSFSKAISLGDGTGAANATAEITRLEFSQLAQVPEPATPLLALAGAAALAGWLRVRAHRIAKHAAVDGALFPEK